MPDSHVFVTRGDLLNFHCDAWMLPTDAALRVEGHWRGTRGLGVGDVEVERRDGFGTDDNLASPVVGDAGGRLVVAVAVPWRGSRDADFLGHIRRAVEQFVVVGADAVHRTDEKSDARILLAMPSFSTGQGGTAAERGRVLSAILVGAREGATSAARRTGRTVDIALILRDAATFAHAQRLRIENVETWSALTAEQRATAQALAAQARDGRLVPFMGAGVSMSAGAPSWRRLLELLADRIGLSDEERSSLFSDSRGALDQATILRSRYDARDEDFLQAVADTVSLTRYGLAPALLATLGTPEAITLNYDTLFEDASNDVKVERRILPAGGDSDAVNWLLKLHGTVAEPSTIVLTRDDYLGFAATRGALSAIVKATLMTRHLLFVGFGLRDDHFHEIVHDVRRAVPAGAGAGATALTLHRDPLDAELWSGSLDLVAMAEPGDELDLAARRLEILLDMLVAHATDRHEYLLDRSFTGVASAAERRLAERLRGLYEADEEERRVPAWPHVERLLRSFGGSDSGWASRPAVGEAVGETISPVELAKELAHTDGGRAIRGFLRSPDDGRGTFAGHEHYGRWQLEPDEAERVRARFTQR